MPEFDAETFAQIATGDGDVQDDADVVDDAGGADNHAEAEGAPAGEDVGSESSVREMLMNSEPNTPLESVDDPWDPEAGGTTRIYRGIQKMAGFDGMPALADLVIGAAEVFQGAKDAVSADGGDSSSSESSDQDDVDDDVDYGGGVPTA